ncbi:Eco57I restriction-modification methylase domain-containing protein [Pseudochelatococcus lubricantis]|uniref:Eco57I restriction-modification methylase domain-containing protein n=1 Tax=Pseudochelatococcus lubricantis TaxID=1538102 RepID=UPI0035E99EED
MHLPTVPDEARRYRIVSAEKARGATYTPERLARFVAEKIADNANIGGRTSLTILDPAIGDGALILALLGVLRDRCDAALDIRGFDTDATALDVAARRIRAAFPDADVQLTRGSFLDFVLETRGSGAPGFDLIIANPPYVRTQIMGAAVARRLASAFGLAGRVDLYHAFLLGMAQVLTPDGVAGIIVSNRFMTTRGGGTVRAALRSRFSLRHIWDLGDTRLFSAAVLPAVIVARGTAAPLSGAPLFSSIYNVTEAATARAPDAVAALDCDGVVAIDDGRRFRVRHGRLDTAGTARDVWRLASGAADEWLATVDRHTWKRFGGIGRIRVGVKTCCDRVFIRHDWDEALGADRPELLRPLTTHHAAGRFRAVLPDKARAILYPHEVAQGQRRPVPLDGFPKSRAYLEAHRTILERRTYVTEAGRQWYELWVPHDPRAWAAPKLVFRDIAERPAFWIDLDGTVVNGDCYWLATDEEQTDLLWLAAAVANSTFAEAFYDRRFNNRLYAGRRRFITQYVEQFPLPDPSLPSVCEIIARAKAIYDADHAAQLPALEAELDDLVWQAFGLAR